MIIKIIILFSQLYIYTHYESKSGLITKTILSFGVKNKIG